MCTTSAGAWIEKRVATLYTDNTESLHDVYTHELSGVKTDKTDGSLTFVLNDELGARDAPILP